MENCSLTCKTAPEFIPNTKACTPRSRFNKRKKQGQKPHSLCDINRGPGDTSQHLDDCHCCIPSKEYDFARLRKQGFVQDVSDVISQILNRAWGTINDPTVRNMVQHYLYTAGWVFGRLPKIQDMSDVIAMLDYVTRIHYHKPVGGFIFEACFGDIAGPDAQSLDWSVLKHMLTGYEALKTHPAIIKFMKMLTLAFSSGFLATLGVEGRMADIWEMISESFTCISAHTDFIAAFFDLGYFVCERIAAFCSTGSWKSLFHTPTSYAEWVDNCYLAIDQSVAMANPAVVGLDYHEYMARLASLIAQGNEIRKYLKAADQKDAVAHVLSRIRVLHTDFLIKNACNGMRMAPFATLVSASSSVGKTSFTAVLFTHYAKLYSKPEGDDFIYTRTAQEPHWNNFKGSHWGLILDDIALVHPNKGINDPSFDPIFCGLGNTSYSPPQAAIEDKGRTPFMVDFVVATTNTENLMAHVWFNNPEALRRRFPYIINVVPKEQYRVPGTEMLDPSKIEPALPGYYVDIWHITVKKIRLLPTKQIETPIILETDSIYVFIQAFNGYLAEHRASQMAFMHSREMMKAVVLCGACGIPNTVCPCTTSLVLQSGEEDDLVPQGLPSLPKIALGSISAYAAYKTIGFVGSCAGEVLSIDPSLLYRPGFLCAATTVRAQTRISHQCGVIQHRIVTYTKERIKEILRGALYQQYCESKPLLKKMLLGMSVLAAAGLTWKLMKREFPEFLNLDLQVEKVDIDNIGVTPSVGTESENVWRKDDYNPSEFLGRLSLSWAKLPLSQVASIVARNVVWCKTSHGGTKHTTFRALCVVGHLYVVPNHVLPHDEYFDLQVIHENNSEGCNGNIQFKVAQSLIFRCPDKELAFFEVRHMPVRRDLRSAIPKCGAKVNGPARVVLRNANGSYEYIESSRSYTAFNKLISQFNTTLDVCVSRVQRDTSNGECGAPVLFSILIQVLLQASIVWADRTIVLLLLW